MFQGTTDPHFAEVGEVFGELFTSGREVGASLCVRSRGRTLVDLWGGWRDTSHTDPWRADTLVVTYSTGKPLAALAALLAVAEGALELDAPISRYWPEYGSAGKEHTTLRQLLCHTAGQPCFPDSARDLPPDDTAALTQALARAAPKFPPGTRIAEHAQTYGYLIDGVLHAVGADPVATAVARVAGALGADLCFGVPDALHDRVADLEVLDGSWVGEYLTRDFAARCLTVPAGRLDPAVVNSPESRRRSSPSDGLFATARGLALLHEDLATPDGRIAQLLGADLWTQMVSPQASGHDAFLDADVTWSLGLRVDDGECGMGGIGGSCAWSSPARDYSFAYVTRGLAGFDRVDELADAVERLL